MTRKDFWCWWRFDKFLQNDSFVLWCLSRMSFTFFMCLYIDAQVMLSLFVLFSSWLSFSCNVFSIVCDLLNSINILCACVHFTASFFFWIKGAALLFLPSELSDIALLHGTGVIAVNFFFCRYRFISSAFFLLREAFNSGSEVAISLTFILSFFVSLFQSNIFLCFLTISPCLNFLPGSLLLLLDIVSNSFRSFVSLLIINLFLTTFITTFMAWLNANR